MFMSKIKFYRSPVWGLMLEIVPLSLTLARAENCSFYWGPTNGSICVCFSKTGTVNTSGCSGDDSEGHQCPQS